MSEGINSLSHSKWCCHYHIVFAPKYRRQSSYSSDELKNGIWTYFLTKAITESNNEAVCKACDRKYITDRKLADYLSNHVSNYAKENYNWTQNPKCYLGYRQTSSGTQWNQLRFQKHILYSK